MLDFIDSKWQDCIIVDKNEFVAKSVKSILKYIKDNYKEVGKTKLDDQGRVVSYDIAEGALQGLEAWEGKIWFDPASRSLFKKQGAEFIRVFDYSDIAAK